MRKTLFSASLLALAVAAPLAQAHQAGDIILRAGAVTVDPREDSDPVTAGSGAVTTTGQATLNSDTQLGLNFAYMVTDKIGIELLAATPFSHDVGIKGLTGALAAANGDFGSIKHLPPTVSVVYYPLDSSSAFQPYVGAGINYTWFFDDTLSSEAESLGFTGLDLKDSWGWAAQLGADYMLTDSLLINAQIRYIDISTTATTRNDALSLGKVEVDVDVDPWVYMVGLGYRF